MALKLTSFRLDVYTVIWKPCILTQRLGKISRLTCWNAQEISLFALFSSPLY